MYSQLAKTRNGCFKICKMIRIGEEMKPIFIAKFLSYVKASYFKCDTDCLAGKEVHQATNRQKQQVEDDTALKLKAHKS